MTTVHAFDVFGCELSGTQLIEASAGTGKTWNLCALYLRLLLEHGLQVPQILVVTFTNAATAELRERIRGRIVETLDRLRGRDAPGADPFVDELLARLRGPLARQDAALQAQLELALHSFDEASILTIHGFCQRALAELPFSTGMPAQLSLLADDRELRQQVVHDFWRRRIAGAALAPEFAAHLRDNHFTPRRLGELLQRRLGKPLSRMRWPEALDAPCAAPDAAALQEVFAAARALWQAGRGAIVAAVRQAQPVLHRTLYADAALQQAIASWDALLALSAAPPSLAELPKLELLGRARLTPTKKQTLPADHAFFTCAQALLDLLTARQQALEVQRLRLLRELLDEGPAALRRAKREQRVLSFDDMLFNLHQRLVAPVGAEPVQHSGASERVLQAVSTEAQSTAVGEATASICNDERRRLGRTSGRGGVLRRLPGLAATLRRRFAAALIDEFQDTDPLQYAIFRAIYGDGERSGGEAPLLLVGDPKQAIYSFRHADLHTYLRARGDARAEYTLSQNQRSTPELLAALNALFGANARAFMLDGLDYRPVSYGARRRTPLRDATAGAPAALQLWQLPRGDDGTPLPKAEAMQRALCACAADIARLLAAAAAGDVSLGDRRLAAGDIAVLVRSHAQGAAMRRALAAVGVGSVELSQASVFDSSDAEELQRVLAAMLEPQRVPLLRAALATEAMGRDAAALHALDGDEAALLDAIARFAGYRERWITHGVGRMLREWMRSEGVSARLLQRADGERRLTNLRHLAECLHEAATDHVAPEALLRWLQAQRGEARRDDAAQLRLESDRNLVQVVTIHKSKGLEYPLVYCPVLWDGYATPRRGGDGLEYRGEGGQPVIDFRALDAEALDAVKQQLALDGAAETMRLIYVALTRAVHRCTLVVGAYTTRHGNGASVAESRRARLNWLVAGAGLSPRQWLDKPPEADAIDAAWAALAQRHAPAVRLDPLPGAAAVPLAPSRIAPDQVAALPAPAHIPPPWWIGSYSSLAHGARHDDAAVDHDQRSAAVGVDAGSAAEVLDAADASGATSAKAHDDDAALPDDDPAAPADDDILRFPRGAVAGECLHAVFEHIAFDDTAHWAGAVDAVLQRFAPLLPPGDAALRRRMLLRMLHDVMQAPLPGGLRLADVPRARTLVELEFHLPSPQLDADALARCMRRQGHAPPRYGFGVLRGYLRGFIDLVFEHQGRWFVLDWKSNHLGDTPADYGGEPLQRAMAQHGYHLQALIYALALHRLLQQRVRGYRHERHFGGVLYLFVRGVRPAWLLADGSSAGVHLQRPSLATLQSLAALLEGRERVT